MNTDDKSFRLDHKTRSFHVSDFALRDFSYLAIAFLLLTLFALSVGWLPAKFLPERWTLFPIALLLGFFLGILFSHWVARPEAKTNYDLSPKAQALARQPSQLIAAIKLFRQEHPDVSLTQAKERIERFCKTGQ
jgi:hypothetical protein